METSENLETQNLESMNWGLDKKIPHHIEGHQCINTARTTEDIHHQVNDGHDVFYSLDGKRLINATGEVTTIGNLDTRTGEIDFDSDAWYSLDGHKLKAKPTQKGLYIYKGKKVVIK